MLIGEDFDKIEVTLLGLDLVEPNVMIGDGIVFILCFCFSFRVKKLDFNDGYTSISLNPSNSFFGLLNYLSIFLYLIIFKSIFYKTKDIFRFYYFIILF